MAHLSATVEIGFSINVYCDARRVVVLMVSHLQLGKEIITPIYVKCWVNGLATLQFILATSNKHVWCLALPILFLIPVTCSMASVMHHQRNFILRSQILRLTDAWINNAAQCSSRCNMIICTTITSFYTSCGFQSRYWKFSQPVYNHTWIVPIFIECEYYWYKNLWFAWKLLHFHTILNLFTWSN